MPEMGLPADKIQHPETRSMAFYDVKAEAEEEAKDVVNSMIEFYLDDELAKQPYVKRKKKADITALAHIIFALKTQQHGIIKLFEEIDMGNMNNKYFDVLERMQGRLESLTKNQMAFRHVLEESYKKIRDDNNDNKAKNPKTVDAPPGSVVVLDDGMKSRGTKEIIEAIRPELGTNGTMIHGGLVDAKQRPDNPHGETEEKPKEHPDPVDEVMFLPTEDK